MTFWWTAAIWSTSVQLPAISAPVVSAVQPPKEAMTSPPRPWIVLMSA